MFGMVGSNTPWANCRGYFVRAGGASDVAPIRSLCPSDLVEGSPRVDGCQCPLEIRYQQRNVGAQKNPATMDGVSLVFVLLVNLYIHTPFESVV